MEKIIFSLSKNGKTIVLDEPEYGVTDYSGLEATDYELEKSVNTNYIGERLKRKKYFPGRSPSKRISLVQMMRNQRKGRN